MLLRAASLGALLLVLCSGCKTFQRVLDLDFVDLPDSRVENLERLHRSDGGHHYTVAFVGDFRYAANLEGRTVGGIRIGSPSSESAGKEKQLDSPSEACLELLDELLAFDPEGKPRLAAVQAAWCARILEQDPSVLSRERAALGLGPLGRLAQIGVPVGLPLDAPRADPATTARLLTDLVRAWRASLEGVAGPGELRAACAELRTTTFDLDGCRRVLPSAAGLLARGKEGSPAYAELLDLVQDFQRRTIQLALARALAEPTGQASRVRAAAVRASVEAGGPEMLARFMPLLEAERQAGEDRDGEVVSALCGEVARRGLPESVEGVSPERYEGLYEGWLDVLVGFAVEDPDGPVRVKAMQALTRLETGPASLREEDWEEWYYARVEDRRRRAGLPPTLDAVEVVPAPGAGDSSP
jgi:hypothetical protein